MEGRDKPDCLEQSFKIIPVKKTPPCCGSGNVTLTMYERTFVNFQSP